MSLLQLIRRDFDPSRFFPVSSTVGVRVQSTIGLELKNTFRGISKRRRRRRERLSEQVFGAREILAAATTTIEKKEQLKERFFFLRFLVHTRIRTHFQHRASPHTHNTIQFNSNRPDNRTNNHRRIGTDFSKEVLTIIDNSLLLLLLLASNPANTSAIYSPLEQQTWVSHATLVTSARLPARRGPPTARRGMHEFLPGLNDGRD